MIQSGKDKDDQGNKLRDKVESAPGKEVLAKIERVDDANTLERHALLIRKPGDRVHHPLA